MYDIMADYLKHLPGQLGFFADVAWGLGCGTHTNNGMGTKV